MAYMDDLLRELEARGATGKIYNAGSSSSQKTSSTQKKKKKEYTEELLDILSQRAIETGNTLELPTYGTIGMDTFKAKDDDIAPIKTVTKVEQDDSLLDFFQKGALGEIDLRKNFRDGYQFGDVLKTGGHVAGQVGKAILGTAGDVGLGVVKGFASAAEGIADLASYGIAAGLDALGKDASASTWRENASENTVEEWTEGADEYLNRYSVAGRTTDAIAQGVGQIGSIIVTGGLGKAAGLGNAAVTALTTGSMGLSGMGSGMGEAYRAGATDEEAATYGLIAGASDALTELLFGGLGKAVGAVGLSKGLSSADDMLAQKVSSLFTNQIAKNFAEYGIKAGAEGFEEVLAGTAQAIGKKITYMDEEELSTILKDENLLEQFVVGAAASGLMQSGMIPGTQEGSLKEANAEGRDFITGLNANEQSVIDKEVEKRIAAQEEKGGKKLTKKEISTIEKTVQEDMGKGFISIDTIEEVLGGETYSNYKKLVDAEEKMQAEYDALGKKEHYTLADDARYKELGERLKYVREKGARSEMKKRLDEQVSSMVEGSRLSESFAERSRRGQAFEADLEQYDEKQRAIVQKAVESGILNNTRRTHEFVDMVARIAADKGVAFDFTNNAKLKESGFAVEGKTVNGFVTKDGITVNIQSAKSLNSVVGHEITHVLEGTELYTELQKAVFQYAESKKDLAGRRGTMTALYQNIEGADIDAELTADLVGDYLFTDSDFISRLSTENRNVFQKIYDEVKYLLKVATAGSKEARQLEQVKRAFEKAYREGGNNKTAEDSGRTYSVTETTDGRIAAVVDNDILASIDTTSWDNTKKEAAKKAASEALKQFSGGIVVDGITRKVNRVSRNEYTRSNYTESLYNHAPDVFADKMRAAEVADDIVVAATNWTRDGGLKHPRTDNIVDFDHGTTLIVSGDAKYTAEVVVGITDKGEAVFYDVVDLKPATFDTKKAEPPTTATTQDAIGSIHGDSADGTVPQNGGDVKYSLVEDQETIDFLENQEHITVYKAMALIDGKLYPPMASQTYVEEEYTTKSGEKKTRRVRKLKNPSVLGRWQQAEERVDIAEKSYDPKKGYSSFDLLKSNGKTTGGVAYNPYEHTSNIVLNDQFSEAYQRPELVTVEYEIPVSELTSGYKAQYAKDPVGLTDWKAGGVAQKLQHGHRDVYLTRWSKPVRVLSDAEVAQKYKEILDKEEGISVPWNVVTQSLREELEKIGVPIDYSDIKAGSTVRSFEAAVRGDYEKPKKAKKAAKYSLASDSEGRQLSAEQREYFKDSKVVDQNGNLKVLYHGTPNGNFTVFRDGSYFTDNRAYAERYQSPSASSISTGKSATAPKVFEVYLDIKKPFDLSDAEARRIYIEEYIKGGNAMGINPYLSDAEYAKIETIDWTEGEDLRDFLMENGYDYDGLVLDEGADGGYGEAVQYRGKSYVVFSSEQVKSVDNAKPTADPDIRYSLASTVKYDGLNEADKASAQKVIRSLRTQDMGAEYGFKSYGTYTQERMEREINTSSSRTAMDYAKSYIAWVDPADFIYATTVSEQGRERIKEEAGTLDIERLRSETQPIHLTVDFETGQIVGHEGRHRMLALQDAGVERVAVIIDAWNDDRHHTKPVDFMRLEGQRFSDYQKGVGFYLHDLLPLSKRYADTARDLFTTKPKKGVQFSLSEEIEPTDRLVAVHNKSVRGLQRMLDRGGVPFASIAIKKAGASHEGFGEVSIVFPRSTIDPEGNRWNKLYSNDAWTPTEPHTEYDVGDTYKYKKLFENMLGSDIYSALRGASYLDSDALERELGSSGGDVFEAVKRLGVVKYGYLQSIGQRPEMTTKQKSLDGFGRYKNDQLMAVFEALDGETIRSATYDSEDVLQQIADTLNEQFMQQLPNDDSVFKSFKKKPLYTADKINIVAIQDAYEAWEAAGRTIPTEPDTYALENAMRDNRELEEDEGYRRWVEDVFDGLIKDSGIPNGRDYYTPSGNRRSFKQLHVPATLENIVQQMRKENETGIGSLGSINLRGAATKTYATVEEMRADSGKLLGTRIDDDVYDGYMDGFHARLNELKLKAAKGDSWSSRDTAEQVLLEAVRDAKTKASMASKLRKEAQWINYEPALVDELWQLKQDVQNMPAPYFEAKPRRIVTTNEAAAYIVPDNAPASLFAKLDEMGLAYKTYKAGDEADRLAQLNSVLDEQPDLRFSLSAEGAEQRAFGNYNVYGSDVALEEDIAPVRQNIAPATVSKNATVADIAPVRKDIGPVAVANNATTTDAAVYEEPLEEESPYAELDRLTEQAEALEQRMYAAMDAGDNEAAMEINADLVDAAVRINELEQQLDADVQDRLGSIEDADAPIVRDAPYSESTDTVTLPRKTVQSITKEARETLGFSTRRSAEMRELVVKFSQGEIDSEMLYDEIADRFGTYTETDSDADVAEVKRELRDTPINVSNEIKSSFADYTASVMRPNFGKIRFSKAKEAGGVDMVYDELSDKFPGFFPKTIIQPADQLQRIIEVANMDANTEQTHELDQAMLESVTDNIVRRVNEYRQEQRRMLSEENSFAAFNSLMADADRYAPVLEEDIAPVRADVAAEPAAPVEEPAVENTANQPIKTVKERLAAKLHNLQTELAENQRLREESRVSYDEEIARLQADYYGRRDKNTKAANNILRRIERLRRIQSDIDADYEKRINELAERTAIASEEARTGESTEAQGAMRRELHARIMENIRARFAERGFDFDEVLKKAKNLSTLATVDNTPQRVMEKALGYKEGQTLADLTVNQVAQHETEGIRWLSSYTDRKTGLLAQISKQYGIKPGSKESAAAQMYAEGFYVAENDDVIEYGDRELAKDFPDAKVQANIKGLARDPRIRQIYDATLAMINESRARNAYPEIQKLDNYFLHFRAMDDTFSRMGIPFNPNDIKAKDLPTDLNGVTADLKPGQPYFASAMHRKGKRTSFDLLGGLEKYLTSAKGQIYHIDDIQTLRALRNHIAETYGQAHGLDGLDIMTEEEAAAQIEQVYDAHLSTFAKFLNEEANVIAGKTALIDRGLEGIIGRRGMTFFDTLNRQVGANMVGFNVSSSLTNFIAPVQAFAKTNKAAFVKGFAQTVANRIGSITGKTDGFAENNPTMIRRKGADQFYRTPWQKAGDLGYALMGAVDSISTEIIVRSKYNELVSKGMSAEQAVIEADKWTSRLMGDRSLGQQPQLYNSKMLGLITKFQLEVRNQLDSQFYDTIQEAKVSAEDIQNKQARNAKVAAQVTSTFVQLAVVQHLFGKAFEAVAGYNPAFDIIEAIMKAFGWDDEEESEDTVLDNLGQGFMSLLEDMPYSSVATGGRIPISSALPVAQLIKGKDQYGNEKSRLETVAETAPYWLLPGGYGQIKKTVQGLGMFDEDLPIAGSYTDSGNLRYPVEDTPLNRAQAAIFGQYASSNARDYFDNERQSLKKNQIQELVDVDIPIREYWDYREGLNDQETLADKFDYIAGLDLPIDKKNILINNVVDRKEAVDLTDYDDYANYEEFDFAVKNPEKYDFLQSVGVSVAEYQSFDDDTKDAYNWAYENPDKYTLSRAVTDDVAVYRQYTKALNDIKADKNAEGKSISGSRKAKVIDYLNGMDADYYTKIILFKMEYNADDTYNREIIEYLNSRNDISFEEEVTILKELGFTVTADGTVRW